MNEEATSANTSPEEAIVVRAILPENAAFAITTMSLTTNPQEHVAQDDDAPFGTHIREAAAIVKDLWKRG
jgi:hypothetical protein